MSKSLKERLAAAKLPERAIQVCLRGDLQAAFDDLDRQLQESRQTGGERRLGQKSESREIAEQIEALREEMAGEMLDVRVRALPRAEWLTLTQENPPREDNAGDEAMGVNLEGLMSAAIPRCVVEPEMDADDWARLMDVLSSGDYDKLFNAVWDVNRSGVDVPKSLLASLVMAEPDDDSK